MLHEFLKWCKDNNIWIDPRLDLRRDETGVSVYSKDSSIPHSTSLVHIPRSCVLSVKSCAVSLDSTLLYGHEAQYALSLALYIEILKGESSRWFGYLQSLPTTTVDLPIFWTYIPSVGPDDGQEAMMWLRGTEVQRHLQRAPEISLETVAAYYRDIVEPTLKQVLQDESGMSKLHPNIHGFCYAYSLVSSRAFFVDAYHGLAMVPVADAFNHSQENHVHLQSEFSVCPHCGSLHECVHDREGSSTLSPADDPAPVARSILHEEDLDDFYEMVSNIPIPPYTEVFNTYGEGLDNAQLLSQYGFILDGNENDRLSWSLNEVYQHISWGSAKIDSGRTAPVPGLKEALDLMGNRCNERVSESQLVYLSSASSTELCLNSDGKISFPLWVLLALPSIDRINSSPALLSDALSSLLDYQLFLEGLTAVDETDMSQVTLTEDPLASPVATLAHRVIFLCMDRRAGLGKENSNHMDLGDILDIIPENMPRTRKAITIALTERSILDSCKHGWTNIANLMYYDNGAR